MNTEDGTSPSTRGRRALPLVAAGLTAVAVGARRAAADGTVTSDRGSEARIRHLLRRATFGPRPRDVAEVRELGIEGWIDRQLKPSRIPDPVVDQRLASFESLKLDGADFIRMLREDVPPVRPPGEGEDRVALARMRQREINRIQDLARREIPRAVILRAVYSERQLQEVMVDFWRNHFNVDVNKGAVRYHIADWEREVLRKHVFGDFETFLMATAKHPAMLFYLDNHVSQAPLARGQRVLQGRDEDRTNGLNENYARELMELHTVGVDNGYDQNDVIQLSLLLTGWSIQDGRFLFRGNYHAQGSKRVMRRTFKSGGIEEGEDAVRHLARHKNTREFVVSKMARYLAKDEPTSKLVADVVKVWAKTKGDLKEVTRAILLHDDFYAREAVLSKSKTPFEFVISCLRVADADVKDAGMLLERLTDMQQPIYSCEDPTGYSDLAADWIDPGVLAVRWRLAYDLLFDRVAGVRVSQSGILDHARQTPDTWESLLIESVFANQPPGSLTLAHFRKRLAKLGATYRKMRPNELRKELSVLVTLLLGSPEFQRQ